MSDLRSAADRFLARTETVTVRVPFDTDAMEVHERAVAAREDAEANYLAAKNAEKTSRRRISDPDIAEPDYAALDAAITAAEAELDANSIFVVLRWRPGAHEEATRWGRKNPDEAMLSVYLRMAEAYFDHVEVVVGEGRESVEMTWKQFTERALEGEQAVVGSAAWELATSSDARFFRKPSRRSDAT